MENEKLCCLKCKSTNLQFVSHKVKTSRNVSIVFFIVTIVTIGLVIWLCQPLSMIIDSMLHTKNDETFQKCFVGIYFLTLFIVQLIITSLISIVCFILTYYKKENKIYYVCTNCGYYEALPDPTEIIKEDKKRER